MVVKTTFNALCVPVSVPRRAESIFKRVVFMCVVFHKHWNERLLCLTVVGWGFNNVTNDEQPKSSCMHTLYGNNCSLAQNDVDVSPSRCFIHFDRMQMNRFWN